MKWCTNCGAQLKDEEKYCSKCGAKQDADSISENVEKKETGKKSTKKGRLIFILILIIMGIILLVCLTFFQKKKLKAEERENLTKFIKTAEWPLDTELEKKYSTYTMRKNKDVIVFDAIKNKNKDSFIDGFAADDKGNEYIMCSSIDGEDTHAVFQASQKEHCLDLLVYIDKDDNYYFEGGKWNKLYNYLNKYKPDYSTEEKDETSNKSDDKKDDLEKEVNDNQNSSSETSQNKEALEEKAKEKQRKEAVDKQKQQQNGFILKYSTEYFNLDTENDHTTIRVTPTSEKEVKIDIHIPDYDDFEYYGNVINSKTVDFKLDAGETIRMVWTDKNNFEVHAINGFADDTIHLVRQLCYALNDQKYNLNAS